jgi:hypothetical protein
MSIQINDVINNSTKINHINYVMHKGYDAWVKILLFTSHRYPVFLQHPTFRSLSSVVIQLVQLIVGEQ